VTHSSLIGPIVVGQVDEDTMTMMMMMMFLLHSQLFASHGKRRSASGRLFALVARAPISSAAQPQSHSNGYTAVDCSSSNPSLLHPTGSLAHLAHILSAQVDVASRV